MKGVASKSVTFPVASIANKAASGSSRSAITFCVALDVPAQDDVAIFTVKNVRSRITLAGRVKQMLARLQSKFPAVINKLVRTGVFPPRPADIGNFPVEALFHIKEELQNQQLVINVMVKAVTSSAADTSAATQKVMTFLEDTDAALLAMLANGEVTLSDAPPFVRL